MISYKMGAAYSPLLLETFRLCTEIKKKTLGENSFLKSLITVLVLNRREHTVLLYLLQFKW